MIICSYCNKETLDEEFCDNCGKFIEKNKSNDNKSSTNIEDERCYKYNKSTLNCIVINSNLTKEDIKKINSEHIQFPIYIKENEIFFIDNEEITFEEYLDNTNLNSEDICMTMNILMNIFKEIEKEGLILGSVSLSDFWIKNNDLSSLFYRQSKRFLVKNDSMENYTIGDIYAPEIINKNIEHIDRKTDVYLLGKLFMKLILNNKVYVHNYEHERFIGYNLQLFNEDMPVELHSWIDRATSIFSDERHKCVSQSIIEFEKIYIQNTIRKNSFINTNDSMLIEYNCITDVGRTKIDISKVIDITKANEDSYLVLQSGDKTFAMIADGVSNCTFGSGFDASNIVKETCFILWNRHFEDLNDKESIKKFLDNIIEISNKNILDMAKNYVNDVSSLNKGIMATTLSVAIIIEDELYYATLGDSPIYLLNQENITLLSIEDNQGNKKIKNGLSWMDYTNLEDKNHLVKYIGGDYALEYIEKEENNIELIESKVEFEVKKIKLIEEDMVIICSDGLTDYINPISERKDIWSNDNKLKSMIRQEEISLAELNEKLVEEANYNGGGDNITIILIKAKKTEGENNQCQEN